MIGAFGQGLWAQREMEPADSEYAIDENARCGSKSQQNEHIERVPGGTNPRPSQRPG
jgi:hypothetical protein